ncbi:MAG TPA: alpha/beta hydrolase [Candidatus Limnocylindrales bacterium]|nr:alpha/beta hydrolase [Candidatus Limnocylindrales bacterium]
MRLRVDAAGDGPAAVFVHGLGHGLDAFPEQTKLADANRVLIVDRIGFGKTPRSGSEAAGWPADAPALIELLEVEGPAHLVGHSDGAVVALLVAGERPDLLRSLVAVEPPLWDIAAAEPDAAALADRLRPIYAQGPGLSPRERWLAVGLAFGNAVERVEAGLAELSDEDWHSIDNSRYEAWPGGAPVALDRIAAAAWPKAIVTGSAPTEPWLEPVRRAMRATARIVARRTGAALMEFDGSTHAPQLEEPERFNRFLRDLWDAAEAPSVP